MATIEILPIGPLGVALLTSLIPRDDLKTRAQANLLMLGLWVTFLIVLYFQQWLAPQSFFLLVGQAVMVSGIKFQRNASLLVPMFWVLIALSAAAIVFSDLRMSLLFSYLQLSCLLFVLLQTGGLYKGSASYESLLFFLCIDLAAYFGFLLNPEYYGSWLGFILLLPGLARTLIPAVSPYVRGLFYNCSTEIMIVMLAGLVPVGLSWLLRFPDFRSELSILRLFCAANFIFAVILFLTEKSRRQKAVYLFMVQSPFFIQMLLGNSNPLQANLAVGLCMAALANSVVWLYFLSSPRIHWINIGVTCLSLGVWVWVS